MKVTTNPGDVVAFSRARGLVLYAGGDAYPPCAWSSEHVALCPKTVLQSLSKAHVRYVIGGAPDDAELFWANLAQRTAGQLELRHVIGPFQIYIVQSDLSS